jgi:hypothetical protein
MSGIARQETFFTRVSVVDDEAVVSPGLRVPAGVDEVVVAHLALVDVAPDHHHTWDQRFCVC